MTNERMVDLALGSSAVQALNSGAVLGLRSVLHCQMGENMKETVDFQKPSGVCVSLRKLCL